MSMTNQFPDASKMVLSPAAQAIWDAWNDAYEAQGPLEGMDQPLAAALRAAARFNPGPFVPELFGEGWDAAMEALANIAAELGGANP